MSNQNLRHVRGALSVQTQRLARIERLCEAGEQTVLVGDPAASTPVRHRLDVLGAFAAWEPAALRAVSRGERLDEASAPSIPVGIDCAFLERYGSALDPRLCHALVTVMDESSSGATASGAKPEDEGQCA